MSLPNATYKDYHLDDMPQVLSARLARLAELLETQLLSSDTLSEPLRAGFLHWKGEIEQGRLLCPTPGEGDGLENAFSDSVIAEAIASMRSEASDAEWLSLWESLQSWKQVVEARGFRSYIETNCGALSESVAEEMSSLFPSEDPLPFTQREMREVVEFFLKTWLELSDSQPALGQQLAFIRLFFSHLVRRYSMPLDFWQILLARLRLYANKGTLPGRISIWEEAISSLEDSPIVILSAHAYYEAVAAQAAEADSPWVDALPMLAVVRRSKRTLRERFLRSLTMDFFPQASDALLQSDAGWMTALRASMERNSLDPLDDQRQWLLEARQRQGQIEQKVASWTDAFRKASEDLAQGMKGAKAVLEVGSVFEYLVKRSLWVASHEPAISWSRKGFTYEMVAVAGIDAQSEVWRKLSQIVASAQSLIRKAVDLPGTNEAAMLLDALRKRGEEMRNFDLSVLAPMMRDSPRVQALPGARCQRDTGLTLTRLLAESRLQGVSGAVPATIRWYGAEVAPYLGEANPAEITDTIEQLTEDSAKLESCPVAVTKLLREFAREFPRLTAAHQLLRHAESIARATADYVFERLPDYDKKVGPNGRISCARDNQLTIERTAELILAGTEEPGEALLEWWSSVVGAYLANRPEGLFESNLQGLYNGIQAHLPNNQVAMAFEPIAHVYRETIGVECMDAKASLPLAFDGPLWKACIGARLSPYDRLYHWEESFYTDYFEESGSNLFEGAGANSVPELLNLLRQFLQNMGRHGDVEAAAKPLYSRFAEQIESFGTDRIARFYLFVGQHLLRTEGLPMIALQEASRALIQQISQIGMALKMQSQVQEIATAFPEALREVAPDFFPEGKAEAVHSKCVRDQTLLVDRLSQLARTEIPTTYWLSAMRYSMEILFPHVQYPTEIWRVAFRNVAAHLAPSLDFFETRALAEWLAQWEDFSQGIAGAHALCKKYFQLGDYTFSADEKEEQQLRGLLAATVTAAIAGEDAPVSGESILRRYVLSSELAPGSASSDGAALVEKLRQVLGADCLPALEAMLLRFVELLGEVAAVIGDAEELSPHYAVNRLLATPRSHEALWVSLAISSHVSPEMSALCAQECKRLVADGLESPKLEKVQMAYESWVDAEKQMTETKITNDAAVFLNEILVAHLIYPFDAEARSVDSAFSDELVTRLGETLFSEKRSGYVDLIKTYGPGLVESSREPNRLRSNLRRAVALLPQVEAGIALWQSAPAMETGPSKVKVSSVERIPEGALQRLLAHYLLRPAIRPPVFGNGSSRRHFDAADFVGTSNHYGAYMGSVLAKSDERQHAPLMGVFLATQNVATPPVSSSWKQLLRVGKVTKPEFIGAFFDSLQEIATKAAAYACRDDAGARDRLQEVLLYQFDTLICVLRETGDLECSIERLKALVIDDLDVVTDDRLVSGYYGMLRHLPDYTPAENVPFWYQVVEESLQAVREVSLGKAVARLAESAAESISSKLFDGEKEGPGGELRAKCVRDQQFLLNALAYAWQTHACNRLVLQVGRFLLQTTLPHLSHDSSVLGNIFTLHEEVFEASLSTQQKHALWRWTGRWQRIILQLAPMSKFFTTLTAGMLRSEHPFVRSQDEDDFIAALVVAAAVPTEGVLHPDGVLARLLMGSDVLTRAHSGAALSLARNLPRWKELGIALPLQFREIIESWKNCVRLAQDLIGLQGPHIVRASGIHGQSALGRVLWQTTVMARSSGGQNQTAPADLHVAEALRLDIPDPAISKKLSQQLRWLRDSWDELKVPESATAKRGLLQKLISKKTDELPVDRNILKGEARFIAFSLLVTDVLGRQPNQMLIEFFMCPQTHGKVTPQTASGTFHFYRDLVEALVEAVGEAHALTRLMRQFQSGLEAAYRSHRLLEGDLRCGRTGRFLALHQWNLKDTSAAVAYSSGGSDDALLALNQMQKHFMDSLPVASDEKDRDAFKTTWDQVLASAGR